MLAHDHRVGVADRRGHQPDHVGRRRRRHDLQARHRHRPVLDRLRVLRAEPQPAAVGRADHQRQGDLSIGHVAGLGDLVGDHVPGNAEEVAEHQLGHRAQAGHRGAHGRTDDRLLADRRVAHPIGPELREQPFRGLEHAAGRGDVLAEHHDRRVALHLLRDPARHRLPIRQLRHSEPPSAQSCGRRHRRVRVGRLARDLLGGGDLRADLALQGVEVGLGDAGLHQPRPMRRNRIPRQPGLDLLLRPIGTGVGARVAAVAIRHGLDQRRTLAGARPLDGGDRHRMDRLDVVAVDDQRLQAVGRGAVRRRTLDRGDRADRRCTPCTGCSRTRRRPAPSTRRPCSAPRGTSRCSSSRRRRSRPPPARSRGTATTTPPPPRSAGGRRRSRTTPSRRARPR